MNHEPTLAKVQLTDGLGHAGETHHLPTPEDLRSYADDADQHSNRWVPIAPASLRGIADEFERLRAKLGQLVLPAIEAAVAVERERCAQIARNGCLVPPDGGSPTEDEAALCEEIARRIREVV